MHKVTQHERVDHSLLSEEKCLVAWSESVPSEEQAIYSVSPRSDSYLYAHISHIVLGNPNTQFINIQDFHNLVGRDATKSEKNLKLQKRV